jgi:mannose-6-phosphate isomerase class I
MNWRNTTQRLAPAIRPPTTQGQYDVYPAFPIGSSRIALGYDAFAEWVVGHRQVILDGYSGVFWEQLRQRLDAALVRRGIRALWFNVEDALLPECEIEHLVEPFLGRDDPLFGTRFTGHLRDFFDKQRLQALRPDPRVALNIIYGCGAALSGWDGFLVYIDLPKNEIQFRSRAGSVRNLGASHAADPKLMYKRFYFVDWVALNEHKAELLPRIDMIVDAQRPDEPTLMSGADLRAALAQMSRNYFRVRTWFEPGLWGGQWLKRHVPQLPQDAPNYAWSFELITPENGLVFESDGRLLEVSFDFLMFQDHRAVLGDCAERFKYEFPIRFDFLDTFDGGNLSVQCHPRSEYIQKHFGERFTQDETYYILDCKPGAQVYLGFQEGINPVEFRSALEQSFQHGRPIDVNRFVKTIPAHKHDLFLIPRGTIHCSGANNLVLEISATPYIFTFKMYDWMRLDLDGRPRPLNIERAFDNLYFKYQGKRVESELISRSTTIACGPGWKRVHFPTHHEHFYDVERLDFNRTVDVATNGSPQVMSLVEGNTVILETKAGLRQRFNYAETFVAPAGAERFRLISENGRQLSVVKAFVKASETKSGC